MDIMSTHDLIEAMRARESSITYYEILPDQIKSQAEFVANLKIPSVPGTMSLHEVRWSASKPATILYREFSCSCLTLDTCACPALRQFDFPVDLIKSDENNNNDENGCQSESEPQNGVEPQKEADDRENEQTQSQGDIRNYIGKYVAVMYNGQPYPGQVVDVDGNEIEVKCLQKVGQNRFVWPAREDKIWYSSEHLLCDIPEPTPVTKRHLEIEPKVWSNILMKV